MMLSKQEKRIPLEYQHGKKARHVEFYPRSRRKLGLGRHQVHPLLAGQSNKALSCLGRDASVGFMTTKMGRSRDDHRSSIKVEQTKFCVEGPIFCGFFYWFWHVGWAMEQSGHSRISMMRYRHHQLILSELRNCGIMGWLRSKSALSRRRCGRSSPTIQAFVSSGVGGRNLLLHRAMRYRRAKVDATPPSVSVTGTTNVSRNHCSGPFPKNGESN